MSDDNKKTEHDDGFTLEDILAEYKGEAFIAGEKKLPAREMQQRAEEIIKEENKKQSVMETAEEPKKEEKEVDKGPEKEPEKRPKKEPKKEPEKRSRLTVIPFEEFEKFKNANSDTSQDFSEKESKEKYKTDTIDKIDIPEDEDTDEEKPKIRRSRFFPFGRNKNDDLPEEETESEEETPPAEEEIPQDEPELKDIYRAYSNKAKSLRMRTVLAALFCIFMALLTFLSDSNFPIHSFSGIYYPVVITLFSMELIVSIIGFDIIKTGFKDILRLRAGAESLVVLSCVASFLDAGAILITRNQGIGIPFSVLAACSMLFALLGASNTARAYMLSFRSAAAVSEIYCVTSEDDRLEGGAVLVKSKGGAEGFITKSHKPNLPEKVLLFAAPILILASIGLSLLASVGKGNPVLFFHCFAAIAAVSAPFSMLLVFGHPFKTLAQRLSAVGAAIAGWQGAKDIGDAVGTVIRDEDLFPSGTLSISGINIITGVPRDKVLSYTGSMIIISGSGLTRTFEELLKEQRCHTVIIEDFSLYEGGGLSGNVGADRVLVGSSGFMNLMGIRVQENMNIKNAIFCAINGSLSGVFLVEYNPTRSVHNALLALLSQRMMTLFAMRDFNITTMMLRQKFKIPAGSADKIDVLTFADRYRLSDPPQRRKMPAGLIFREGLGPFANVVLGGRNLQTTVRIGTAILMLGAAFGVAFMFFMCSKGAFSAASAANTLVFMLAWLLPTFFLSKMVNRY